MKSFWCAVAVLGFAAEAVVAQSPTLRPMTVDDGLRMVQVGEGLISPDGKSVLYSTSELDWARNRRKTTHFMIQATGGQPHRYIGEEGGNAFAFSPKGTYLSFLRRVEMAQQVFVMNLALGGEAVQLTSHPGGVASFQWSQDENRIFFLADEQRGKEEERAYKAGDDAVYVDEGPNGQVEGSWRALWQFDVKTRQESRVTEPNIIVGDFDVSPDGSRVIFTARFENRRNQIDLTEIYLVDVATKARRQLTHNRAPEGSLSFSPDGKSVAYVATDDGNWELRTRKIWVMNPETGEHRVVSAKFDGDLRQYYWSPDGRSFLFTGQEGTNSNLYRIDIATTAVSKLTNFTGSFNLSSLSRDGKQMVYSFSDLKTPGDLYCSPVDKLAPVRLTDANPWITKEIALASGQVIRWKGRDGREIEGILFLPSGYQAGRRLPVVLNIHGGPAALNDNSFRATYHIWAGLGFASLCPNYRGSSGYGEEFLRANMKDLGGGEFEDLMSGLDYVIAQGYVDPQKTAVRGWSWGGVLGSWTVTHTDRFKSAALGALVTDWIAEFANGFNYNLVRWYIGGPYWENPEGYRKASSLTSIKNCNTPTLVMHGAVDRTVSEPQSLTFFTALKDRGVPARYIRFPREAHGLREPRHQRLREIEEIQWIQKYTMGLDWKPWAAPLP